MPRGPDALGIAVLRVAAASGAGCTASELAAAMGDSAFAGLSSVARARRASAELLALADAGLLVRNAGRTARFSITPSGLDELRSR